MTSEKRGASGNTKSPRQRGALRSTSVNGQPREADRPVMPTIVPVFKIFLDASGMYRWLLTDEAGQRVERSRHAFAGLAGAWNDADAARSVDRPNAQIDASQFAA